MIEAKQLAQHRAETITNTELAFAYNQGAHAGVMRAISQNLMGRCAMVWTTAGTNRVCSRCLALKDTVVGYTNESGVTLPPLHPRCRCAISYREPKDDEKPRGSFHRPTANSGAFAHLKVPLQLRAVKQICRKYGVDISGLQIKIQRSEEWLTAKYKYAGMTDYYNIGRIDLTPHAFADEEELLRTIIHESCHVKQLKKYGRNYAQEHIIQMEKVAERYENFFLRIAKRRRQKCLVRQEDRNGWMKF